MCFGYTAIRIKRSQEHKRRYEEEDTLECGSLSIAEYSTHQIHCTPPSVLAID